MAISRDFQPLAQHNLSLNPLVYRDDEMRQALVRVQEARVFPRLRYDSDFPTLHH